jgi:hypothetical protein
MLRVSTVHCAATALFACGARGVTVVTTLAAAFLTGFRSLRLANIGMTYFGATEFAKALGTETFGVRLQELDIRDNSIIADGVVAIANVLGKSLKLVTLQLDNVKMGVLGALRLSTALMPCTNLQHLHLRGNRVSVAGGGALIKALPCYQVSCSGSPCNIVTALRCGLFPLRHRKFAIAGVLCNVALVHTGAPVG